MTACTRVLGRGLSLALFAAPAAAQRTFIVDISGGVGSHFRNIQPALDAVAHGDTIRRPRAARTVALRHLAHSASDIGEDAIDELRGGLREAPSCSPSSDPSATKRHPELWRRCLRVPSRIARGARLRFRCVRPALLRRVIAWSP
jgi:hypothetical protein